MTEVHIEYQGRSIVLRGADADAWTAKVAEIPFGTPFGQRKQLEHRALIEVLGARL